MKNILYLLLFSIIVIMAVSCSIKEDMDDCPPIEDERIVLEFECIRIYDTGDREIVFDKVTEELDLLFYDKTGNLVQELSYTAAQLKASGWKVYLDEEIVKSRNYTLLAIVNYKNEHYTVTGKENLESLVSGLKYEPSRQVGKVTDEIDFPLTDTYYGRYDLQLNYDSAIRSHKVLLSKNTNFINLTMIFQNEEDYHSVTSIETRIAGNNTLYDWQNKAIEATSVKYVPYFSDFSNENRWFLDMNKTMRIWHESDLRLDTNIAAAGLVHNQTQNIAEWLAKDDRYNTDDKLEHYDEFNIEITYAKGFIVVSVKINGWYIIDIGEPL